MAASSRSISSRSSTRGCLLALGGIFKLLDVRFVAGGPGDALAPLALRHLGTRLRLVIQERDGSVEVAVDFGEKALGLLVSVLGLRKLGPRLLHRHGLPRLLRLGGAKFTEVSGFAFARAAERRRSGSYVTRIARKDRTGSRSLSAPRFHVELGRLH